MSETISKELLKKRDGCKLADIIVGTLSICAECCFDDCIVGAGWFLSFQKAKRVKMAKTLSQDGKSNKEIAQILHIKVKTVNNYLHDILISPML